MLYSTDPFSLVERKIMAALVSYPPLGALVRPDNRISFTDGEVEPIKENPSNADLPELLVYAIGGEFNAQGSTSSSSVGIVQRYAIGVHTNDQRTNAPAGQGINELKWRVFQACEAIHNTSKPGEVLGLPFVRICRLTSFADQFGVDTFPPMNGLPSRIIEGWSFVVTLEVVMVIKREPAL